MSQPILILTALEVEREAVEKHLAELAPAPHPETKTDYTKGKFQGREIIVARTNQTNVNAALETERAIDFFKPCVAIYVGVAGGLKDVQVGDIVIGEEVIGYERGKTTDEGFKPRPQFGASSYDMERQAAAYAKTEDWKGMRESLLNRTFHEEIQVLSGVIASGEKVDASTNSELHKHIKQNASHAFAIEMEGLGFLKVCWTRPSVKSLLLRGISDLVNDKGQMDGKGSQPYASQNVAAFLFGFLGQLESSQEIDTPSRSDVLFEVFCKLYPRGIEDQGIWVRSGGDLSMVPLYQAGKGQWTEALRLIGNGGGGDISEERLIGKALEDFGGNVGLQNLKT